MGDVNMDQVVLSICIALHNRSNIVSEHIFELISNDDQRYNIIVSDSSDEGKGLLDLYGFEDERVFVYRINKDTPAMLNWKNALDKANGLFAFHLNDRDIIHVDQLGELLDFLEDHTTFSGGICKKIRTFSDTQIFIDAEDAFMNIPFFASHPTGVIFNVNQYRLLGDTRDCFSYESGIHPHDIILGKLSENGNMFIYTKDVWDLASEEFYKKNKSGFERKKSKLFFEPEERMRELTQNIIQIRKLRFKDEIRRRKIDQMYKTYLGLSTNSYFYVMESDHETLHYGVEKKKRGLFSRMLFANNVLEMYSKEYHFTVSQKWKYRNWLFKTILIPYIGKKVSNTNNRAIQHIINKMRIRRYTKEDALLR